MRIGNSSYFQGFSILGVLGAAFAKVALLLPDPERQVAFYFLKSKI